MVEAAGHRRRDRGAMASRGVATGAVIAAGELSDDEHQDHEGGNDGESMLAAWHERQVAGHLEQLARIRDQPGSAGERLQAVLETLALMSHRHHDSELAALLHRGEHLAEAHRRLSDFIRDLLAEGAEAGEMRGDVAPEELASYCLNELAAASKLPSKAAVQRLVSVILAGLRPSA